MMTVSAQTSRLRRSARPLLVSAALTIPGTAWAACTPDATGFIITCDGASTSYTNTASGLTVNADGTAVVVAPLVIGNNSTLTVAGNGQIQGSTAVASVQFGDYATITNNGTITSGATTAGAAAIQVGINSTVTNNGTLTAVTGTPVVSFTTTGFNNTNGTFINGATAATAVTGDLHFGYNSGTSAGTFINRYNTMITSTSTTNYGFDGNVFGNGNLSIDNEGQWTGNLVQTAYANGNVNFVNGVNASFTGTIDTGDTATIVNNATGINSAGVANAMLLNNGTVLGGSASSANSSLTNNGTLTIGSTIAPGLVTINGNFIQSSTGILNMAIAASGAVTSTATVQPYSQIYAANGNASLAGTLNVNITAGYFPTGTKFELIVADKSITGNFGTVNITNANGAALPFLTFASLGVQSVGTQQAYEIAVQRNGTYASVLTAAGVGTPNQIAVAKALQPMTVIADASTTSQEAALIGQVDQETIPGATALFDQLSPAGYLNWAIALRDEANLFERNIALRMADQNSDHAEDGWWGSIQTQFDAASATTDHAKDSLFGLNVGYDLSGPHHVFGVATSFMVDSLHTQYDVLTGHNRDIAVAGYGGYNLGPVHFTGMVQYNLGHLGATHNLTFTTSTLQGTASANEHLFKAMGTAGFILKAGGYAFEPFAGIDFNRGAVSGFTEQYDGAAALQVLPISANRTDALFGLNLTRASGKFRPYLRAVYRNQVGNGGAAMVSAFFDGGTINAPDLPVTVAGVPAARHQEEINAGANWVFEDAGSLFVGYQGTMRSGYNANGINLGIRLEF
ncbi:MAG: hypothetical protein KGK11_01800 [Sphingomonadales bacterium]|nr:hypothetical protein [Sphingomonadales bacterium]